MKAFVMLLAFSLTGALQAQNLCGGAYARVCLENSTGFTINGLTLLPGTSIVFSVPGIEINGSDSIEGDPSRPYRLELNGNVTDDRGGVWTEAQSLGVDDRGNTAIRYQLQEGFLADPVTVLVSNVRVCQRVIDGPGDVDIAITIFGANKRAMSYTLTLNPDKMEPVFDPCADNTSAMPVPSETLELHVSNPYDEAAALTLNGETSLLEPGQKVVLNLNDPSELQTLSGSMELPITAFSESGDLFAVSLRGAQSQSWLLPHLARDTNSWRNRWIFAQDQQASVSYREADNVSSMVYDRGVHEQIMSKDAQAQSSWTRVNGNVPINGFLAFDRNDGDGGAWVAGVPGNREGGPTTLYLPHITRDRASFWTGYSLANESSTTTASGTMRAFNASGELLGEEGFTIEPGANEVGIIGSARFIGMDDVAWLEIESDNTLAGLELIGSVGVGNLSGFLLPSAPANNLAFPLLRNDGQLFSALALVNTGDTAQDAEIQWTDAQGNIVDTQLVNLNARGQWTGIAPSGATQAQVTGQDLVGFCLIGHGDGRTAGYLGKEY